MLLLALAFLAASAHAQGVREKALDKQKQDLEAERLEHEKERTKEEHRRPELSRPVEKKRDARACENARIAYQTQCGSPAAPRYRNPGCRDADLLVRQACQ